MTTTIIKDTIRTNLISAFDVNFSRAQLFARPTTATAAQSMGMFTKYAQDATAKRSSGLLSLISQGKQRTSAQPTSENHGYESPIPGNTGQQTTGLNFLNTDETSGTGLDSSKFDVVSVLLAHHTNTMFSNITGPKFTTARASTVTTAPVRLNLTLDRLGSISTSAASSVNQPSLKPTRKLPSVFFTVTDTTSASVSQHSVSVKLKSKTTIQTPKPTSSQPVTVLLASSQITNRTLSFIGSAITDEINAQPITSSSASTEVANVDEQSSLGNSSVMQ